MAKLNTLRLIKSTEASSGERPSDNPRKSAVDGRSSGSKTWLASIVEHSDDAIIGKDLNGIITSWNRAAGQLFGYTAEEAIGRPINILIPADRADEEAEILGRIRRGDHIQHFETLRRRKDGTLVDISISVSPIKDESGEIVGAAKIARDITERRARESQQRLLLSEMNHRIRNTLATVQAIAMQTLRGATPAERASFSARLQSLARAHDLLTLERWNRTSPREVIARALEAFDEQHRGRFHADGPDVMTLEAGKAMMLAMVFHELATNAVKYGALSAPGGYVDITWEEVAVERSRRIRLRWREAGGPPVAPLSGDARRQGFGTRLIELSGGKLDYEPAGVICVVEIEL